MAWENANRIAHQLLLDYLKMLCGFFSGINEA